MTKANSTVTSGVDSTTLRGKTAIVTGSTSGIGLGIVRALTARGANVVLNGLDPHNEIENIRRRLIRNHDVEVLYSGADPSRLQQVAKMVESALAAFGRVNILGGGLKES